MRVIVNKFVGGRPYFYVDKVNKLDDYYKHMDCSLFDCVYVEHKGHKLTVFCDDEGMLKEGNLGRLVGNYPQPIFGDIVIAGDVDEEGNTLPCKLELEELVDFIGDSVFEIRGS